MSMKGEIIWRIGLIYVLMTLIAGAIIFKTFHVQMWLVVGEFNGGFGAYDADPVSVHAAGIDSRSPHTSHGTVFIAHQNISVVLKGFP